MTAPRLTLTADLFRPYLVGTTWESGTWKHVRWLDGIVGTAARLGGWQVGTASWDARLRGDHHYFHTPDLYEQAGLPLTMEGWGKLLSLETLPAGVANAVTELFRGTTVVGYELPDLMCRLLDQAGIAVIDLILYPVRFLDDVVFAARTNRASIHRMLLHNLLDLRDAVLRAGFVRSKASFMTPLNLRPGTTLILGQVPDDRAALDLETGRFVQLGDYLSDLIELSVRSSAVLFKPHPYDQPHSAARKAIKSLRSVGWTDLNLYQLLAQPEIETVCALNSSGLVEAELFGKRTIALKPPLYRFGTGAPGTDGGFGDAVPQSAGWYSPQTWHCLLDESHSLPEFSHGLEKDRLRRALNADWGFGAIDRVVA
ncbi:hypothetical protein JQ544_19540 [Bradyrhizobium diazoefficiens]|nr:hypothetical protein [Bradyrhizobium diazoefficiens]MBR0813735.1 hypothetical protein [Bradyrhizobium diazoefficiens]